MPMSRLLAGTSVMSRPSSRTRPASGRSKPAIARSAVVLPQPEGPSGAISQPRGAGRRDHLPPGEVEFEAVEGEPGAVPPGQPLQADGDPGAVAQLGGG